MPYGVVACPSCRKAKGYEVGVRTTACPLCGRRLDVTRLVTEVVETEADLVALVGAVNARLAGATEEELASMAPPEEPRPPPSDAMAAVVRAAREVTGEVARSDAAAKALTSMLGEFSEAEYAEALETIGVPRGRAGAHLKRMLVTHVVFEPRAGRYKAL